MEKTEQLTPAEIARLDTTPRFNLYGMGDIQRETIALRKRTGLRYGTAVGGGRFNIHVLAFALDAKGKPKGSATVRVIADGLRLEDVPAALSAL